MRACGFKTPTLQRRLNGTSPSGRVFVRETSGDMLAGSWDLVSYSFQRGFEAMWDLARVDHSGLLHLPLLSLWRQSVELASLHQFVALYSLPILSLEPTVEPECFNGWDRGIRLRMMVSASYRGCGRAIIDDAFVLSYVASRAVRAIASSGAFPAMIIDPAVLLHDLRLPVNDAEISKVWGSLRRIGSTYIHLNRDGMITGLAPLLALKLRDDGRTFLAAPSQFLVDEIISDRFFDVPLAALNYCGMQARLYGWAHVGVGRQLGGGRIITRREALARVGGVGERDKRWAAILSAISENGIPGFSSSAIEYDGAQAVFISELEPASPRRSCSRM